MRAPSVAVARARVPPQLWLAQFLGSALSTSRFERAPFKDLRFHFWADIAPPSHRGGIEGATEVDVMIEFDDSVILVEAKLGAELSLRTAHDPSRDQLLRLLDVGYAHVEDQQLFKREVFVIVVGPQIVAPRLVRKYQSFSKLERALRESGRADSTEAAQCLVGRVGYASWLDVASSASVQSAGPIANSLVAEVKSYVRAKVREWGPDQIRQAEVKAHFSKDQELAKSKRSDQDALGLRPKDGKDE